MSSRIPMSSTGMSSIGQTGRAQGLKGPTKTGNLRINKQHTLTKGFFGLKVHRVDSFIEEEWVHETGSYWAPLRIEETFRKVNLGVY